ncbi:PD40 domain-containing protein [Gelidibacter salicanalis]|uniref:PD40 domain-containing protein n=1 Tax=Gelidibacter salicanalis TaxID=291193 RepID=A0A934KSP7_9FLAO|nr:PD40 domain-containing protein [Gelidibacter salicanalis]MBJ7880032.1 PD40 domain-containing protein [Gelidibacter salicanalis]
MKIIKLVILLFVSQVITAQNSAEITQFNEVLNQFMNVRDFCMSKDGTEAFFTIQSPGQEISQLASLTMKNNIWSQPELLPFCDVFMYLEPFLSYDNKRLFFVSDRPLDASSDHKKDFDIWYSDRSGKDATWSEPKNMGKPVNSVLDEFYPSVSKNNNLYFTMVSPKGYGKDDLYVCKWEDGSYSNPTLLNNNINSEGYEFNAFISEEEDFIIYSKYNEKDGQGSGDLYISKKDADGEWKKPTNLGVPINSKYMDYCPFYDAQNQILYFTSKRNTLKSRKFSSISDLTSYLNQSHNGNSKIYRTSLSIE